MQKTQAKSGRPIIRQRNHGKAEKPSQGSEAIVSMYKSSKQHGVTGRQILKQVGEEGEQADKQTDNGERRETDD